MQCNNNVAEGPFADNNWKAQHIKKIWGELQCSYYGVCQEPDECETGFTRLKPNAV